jgi:WD40 repeat protein
LPASSGKDPAVRLWAPYNGTNLQTLPHPHLVYAITWSPDGGILASCGDDGAIMIWDLHSAEHLKTL